MKAGLEVHQQLATGKLFCGCPSELSETVTAEVQRRLRATGGESQHVDAAAAFQAARGLSYRYEATPTSCLVELDEEPPHPINADALDVALTLALLLDARPLDEIEVMRKIVVDGSNTAGFQRTALVAVDGSLPVGEKRYSIPTICLEEDAARKVGEGKDELRYRVDRLGIPLIEIATGPEITNGAEAREVAEELGALLRATRRVRRGIGTIREDLNVSIPGGARVELKGVQELRLIHKYAEIEDERQRVLLEAKEALERQGARAVEDAPVDLTEALGSVASGPVHESLKRGGRVVGLKLPGFAGVLRPPGDSPERLGRELADQARATGLKGLLHSDELPGYGIDAPLLERISRQMQLGPRDGFVLVAAATEEARRAALERVRSRANAARQGVPSETRDPLPDGRSRYSRPLPGRDRMYPETDVPPVPISAERLSEIRARLPERPAAVRARLSEAHHLPMELVRQLQQLDEVERFERLVARPHDAAAVARLLTQSLTAVASGAEGRTEVLEAVLERLLVGIERGEFAKEAIPPILSALGSGAPSVEDAVRCVGLSAMASSDLDRLADAVVARNESMIRSKGAEAFSPLMGDLMRDVRGRIDGETVAKSLRAAIARRQAVAGA